MRNLYGNTIEKLQACRFVFDEECSGCTFDLWGTAVQSRFQVPDSFQKVEGAHGLIGTSKQFCNEPVLLFQKLLNVKNCGGCSGSCGPDPLFLDHCMMHQAPNADVATYLEDTAALFKACPSSEMLEGFEQIIRLERNHLAVFPDVPAALAKFEQEGFTLSTNSNAMQFSEEPIMQLPIGTRLFGDFFKAKIFSFKEKARKPDRAMFEAVERDTGIPLSKQIMIEDNRICALAALEAGYAFVVILDRTESMTKEDIAALPDRALYCRNLEELMDMLFG